MISNGLNTSNGASKHQSTMPHAAPVGSDLNPPYCKEILVTPEVAARWLEANTFNRNITKSKVRAYVRDLLAGRWGFNPQPISFGTDRTLLDGQHRLTAVVESGVSVKMIVWFNVPPAARDVMDQGKPRSLRDVARISPLKAAISSSMMRGSSRAHISATVSEKAAFYQRFAAEIDWVMSVYQTSRAGLRASTVYAAIVRASFHVAADDLKIFCEVLMSGMPTGQDRDATVIRLRDKLLQPKSGRNGAMVTLDSYGSTTSAIKAFSEGRALSKIYPASSELFPLPAATTE